MSHTGQDRRVYARHDAALTIEFEVTEGAGQSNRMRGTTINISRGGVLADVGLAAEPGSACRIVFRDGDEHVQPAEVVGRVVHVGVWTHGRSAIAVQFDRPLDKLEVAGS